MVEPNGAPYKHTYNRCMDSKHWVWQTFDFLSVFHIGGLVGFDFIRRVRDIFSQMDTKFSARDWFTSLGIFLISHWSTGRRPGSYVRQVGSAQARRTPFPQFSHDSQSLVLATPDGGVEVYLCSDGSLLNRYDLNRLDVYHPKKSFKIVCFGESGPLCRVL